MKLLKNINVNNIMKKNMNGDASSILNGVAAIASGDPTAIMTAMVGDPDAKQEDNAGNAKEEMPPPKTEDEKTEEEKQKDKDDQKQNEEDKKSMNKNKP